MRTEADFQLDVVLDAKAEIHEQDDGTTIIEGIASDFDFDRADEAFEPGVWEAAEKAFMQNPVLLYHHKPDFAVGRVLEVKHLGDPGMWVKAILDAPEPGTQAADVVRKVRSGTIKAFSVGGKFFRRKGQDGRTRIWKSDWRELSITPLPVNPRTLFGVAGKAFEDEADEYTELGKRLTDLSNTLDGLLERVK